MMLDTEDPKSKKQQSLLPFFIFVFISGGIVRPFMNIYLVEAGMSLVQIGIVQAFTSVLIIIIAPILGWYSDKYEAHRRVLNVAVLLKGLTTLFLAFFSSFAMLTVFVGLRELSARVHDAIMNQLAFDRSSRHGGRGLGSTRMWGAVAYMVSSYAAGLLTRKFSLSTIFVVAGLFSVSACFWIRAFPQALHKKDVISEGTSFTFFNLLNPALCTVILLFSMACQGSNVFFFIHASSTLGVSKEGIGLLGSVGALGEVCSLFLADRLVNLFGPSKTIKLAMLASAFGWVGLAFAETNAAVIPFLFLQRGASSGFYLIPLMAILTNSHTDKRSASRQMVAQVTLPGIAAILGQPIGGFMVQNLGSKVLLISYAVLALLAAMVLIVSHKAGRGIPSRL